VWALRQNARSGNLRALFWVNRLTEGSGRRLVLDEETVGSRAFY